MKVVVVGDGVMGLGLVELFIGAKNIREVCWICKTEERAGRQSENIDRILRAAKKKGTLDAEISQLAAKVRIDWEIDSKISSFQFVVEAVTESWGAKLKILDKIDCSLGHDGIIATNTSSFSINRLAKQLNNSSRFIGLHFFNPPIDMELVEVAISSLTSEKTLNRSLDFLYSLGKKPVQVKDSPGFVVNRLIFPLINDAINILHQGVASSRDIDDAMVLGVNHPVGPLKLADMIGLDVCLTILQEMYDQTGDLKYLPSPLLVDMVSRGYLGKKNKKGFRIGAR